MKGGDDQMVAKLLCPVCGCNRVDFEILEPIVPTAPNTELIRHTCDDCGCVEDVVVHFNGGE